MMKKLFKRIAVLKGGPSAEREVSLASGTAVARGLREAGYDVEEVDVRSHDVNLPGGIDAVFIVLHGDFGEDGTIQAMLRDRDIPYTGSSPESSRISFDKRLSKKRFRELAIPTPASELLKRGQLRTLALPVVVKPPRQGSSIGIFRVFEEEQWPAALADCLTHEGEALVEQFIPGTELTVGIVCDEALPIIEIRAPNGYYDYVAKYTKGRTEYLVPAPIPAAQTETCRAVALKVYHALGCSGMGRVDIRLSPDGLPYVLELNTIPGFTETSLLPKAAQAAGMTFSGLCDRILRSASVK